MIICELGHNHVGDTRYADEYVEAFLQAKPDAVTFQYREPARYQGESAHFRLPDAYMAEAARRFHDSGIMFGMAIGDETKIDFFETIGVDFYKVLGKDISNASLIKRIAQTGKPYFVSTGMSGLQEIDAMAFPAKKAGHSFSLIHTTLNHELKDVNLKAISTLRERYGVPVAFGSHATNYRVLYIALGFEPSDIFFYVKGNRPVKHSDGAHSVSLSDVAEVVSNLRELLVAIGSGEKVKVENLIRKEDNKKPT